MYGKDRLKSGQDKKKSLTLKSQQEKEDNASFLLPKILKWKSIRYFRRIYIRMLKKYINYGVNYCKNYYLPKPTSI